MDPIGQSFTSISVSDDEVYTFSETKKQPDKCNFEQEILKETSSMFDNEFWDTVPTQKINSYCDELN